MDRFEEQHFRQQFERLAGAHNDLVKLVNEMSIQQAKAQQRTQIEAIKEIVTHSYSRAASYNNLIIIAGYAAFFTVWKSMKSDLNRTLILFSGLFVLISAFLFIVSQVHAMFARTIFFSKFMAKMPKEPPPTFVDDVRKAEEKHTRRMFGVWLIFFVPTATLGLIGGAMLTVAFGYSLVCELCK